MALLVGGYVVGLGAMVATRGLYLSPDRYFLILLVPALALGLARRYIVDFLPFIVLMIVYELARGYAHVLSPSPYYRPQLDAEKALFGGTVPTLWLQEHLWHGQVRWFDALLNFIDHLHFIVPPTLLFLIWLTSRTLYYRLATTMLAVSFAGAIGFWLFPAAPPWLASKQGYIGALTRIGQQSVTSAPVGSSNHSWISQHLVDRWRNDVAAIPSLHAAYALLVVLFCYALSRRAGRLAIPYAVAMWFTIVYFGEHYVVDAVIGVGFAVSGWIAVGRLLPRTRLGRSFPPPLAAARGAPER